SLRPRGDRRWASGVPGAWARRFGKRLCRHPLRAGPALPQDPRTRHARPWALARARRPADAARADGPAPRVRASRAAPARVGGGQLPGGRALHPARRRSARTCPGAGAPRPRWRTGGGGADGGAVEPPRRPDPRAGAGDERAPLPPPAALAAPLRQPHAVVLWHPHRPGPDRGGASRTGPRARDARLPPAAGVVVV